MRNYADGCSQCNFSAQFESALTMHHQLHHSFATLEEPRAKSPVLIKHKSNTMPRWHVVGNMQHKKEGIKLSAASSATKLFDRLRAKVCKSRTTLFVHPEEPNLERSLELMKTEASTESHCTPMGNTKLFKNTSSKIAKTESYACHLCSFISDRITVLDRHLLNDHKIGLDNLLKLVMAKTKEGLTEGDTDEYNMLSHQPYYKCESPTIEENEGKEFIIETIHPKIKVMKHASSNTDLTWTDIVEVIKKVEDIDAADVPADVNAKDDLVAKISTLNECMCKFVDSTNTLKRVLNANELDSKHSIRGNRSNVDGPIFDLALDDDGRRTQSDKIEKRYRDKSSRSAKSTLASDSYFF